MNKVTDEQIKKALECCNKPFSKNSCEDCPFHHSKGRCTENMLTNALDLINRQKAEIERLKEEKEGLLFSVQSLSGLANSIKSEAYKEFAEKVFENTCVYEFENKAEGYTEGVVDTIDFYIVKINDTLTELTEGGNEDG